MKKDKVIAIIVVVVCLLPIIFIASSMKSVKTKQSFSDNESAITNYNNGLKDYNNQEWKLAKSHFEKITSRDTLYNEASNMIENCRNKILLGSKTSKGGTDNSKSSTNNWEEQFINFREEGNKDIKKLVIDKSVLYIYVNRVTSDLDFYSKMYTTQFQKAYHENVGGSNVGTMVYYNNKLIKEYSANNDGLK